MGKGFDKDKLKAGAIGRTLVIICFGVALFVAADAGASRREFDLFNKGYEYYLSYQPEKAAETLRAFLKEFPESSAADAALYWTGKSLLQLRAYDDARKVFSEIRRRFPESPYIKYVDKEEAMTTALESEKQSAGKSGTGTGSVAKKKGAAAEKPVERKPVILIVKGRKYDESQISRFMSSFSAAMTKSDIGKIAWLTGNSLEDFISEEVLYNEARSSDVTVSREELRGLAEKFKLTTEETDLTGRYLAIRNLISRKMENMSEERSLEVLVVKYAGTGSNKRVALASALQERARKGESFKDIAKLYSDSVTLSAMKVRDLQGWLKDSVKGLKEGEVSVVWKRDGFLILKPAQDNSYRMAAGSPGEEDAAKEFVKHWVEELRKKDDSIKIVRE